MNWVLTLILYFLLILNKDIYNQIIEQDSWWRDQHNCVSVMGAGATGAAGAIAPFVLKFYFFPGVASKQAISKKPRFARL